MSIDKNLGEIESSIPLIRQINQAACKIPGKESISLGLGQLGNGFPLAPEILNVKKEIITSLEEGKNNSVMYSPNAGNLELRNQIAIEQGNKDQKEYNNENVLITIGVQNAMQATIGTLNKLGAKRVLIPEINFGIYKKIPESFNMEVITYKLNNDYSIDLNFLKDNLKDDDLIIFNSPANPTGKVLSEQEIKEIGKLLNEKLTNGYIISDEIYDKLVYDDNATPTSISKYCNRTITLNGVSKSGAMAGTRVGWIISENEKLIKAIGSFNTNQISSPPTENQLQSIPVVSGKTSKTIEYYNKILLENRELAKKVLDKLDMNYVNPEGSFYIFPKIITHLQKQTNTAVFDYCLQTAQKENGVVVIPGQAFGTTKKAIDNIRISLAVSSDKFEEAMDIFEKSFS